MHRLAVTVLPESNQSYILLSCLSSEEKIYHDFFEQIKVSVTSKVLYYFNLLLPLFSENLVISEKLWDNHSEKGQFGLVHMAALIGTDQFNLSHTIGMALRMLQRTRKWIIQNAVRLICFKQYRRVVKFGLMSELLNCSNCQQSQWSNCIKCSNVLSLCSIVQEVYSEER